MAREAAAFVAEKGALPAEPLRRFMAAHCGAVTSQVTVASKSGQVPTATPEAEIYRR